MGDCSNGIRHVYKPQQVTSDEIADVAQMGGAKPIQAQSRFDTIVNELDGAVSGYEDKVKKLTYLLEAPRPACDQAQNIPISPLTVQEAVSHAADRINDANISLLNIVDRLQEQVGELKILP